MITCPNCGTENRAINTFCTKCGHNLAASSPAAPTNTPTDDLPDWLRDLQSPSTTAAAPPAQEVPAAEPALPAWLVEPDPQVNGAHATPVAAEELPVWLRDSQPASALVPGAGSDLPPWLQTTAEATPNSRTPEVQPMVTHEELPEWLRLPVEQSASITQPVAPSPPPADELPDWLRNSEQPVPEQAIKPQPVVADGLPDWLREAETPVAAAETSSQAPRNQPTVPPPGADTDLPDWLRDTDTTGGATVPVIAAEPPVVGATQSLPTADNLPAWLQNTAETQGATQPLTTAEPPQPPIPAAEVVIEGEPQLPVPDWLNELGIDSVADTSPAPVPVSQTETASTPSWLEHEETPAAAATEQAPPSWLTDVSDGSPSIGAQLPQSENRVSTQTQAQEVNELPAWLTMPDDPVPTAQAPTLGHDASMSSTGADSAQARVVDVANEHELPAWLRETTPMSTPPKSPATEPLPTQTIDDLPAWLRDDTDEHQGTQVDEAAARTAEHHAHVYEAAPPPAAAGDTALPAWLTGFNEPTPQAGSSPLPSWLEEQPSKAVAPTPVAPAAPANEFLGSLDLPDWLHEPASQAPARQPMPSYLDTPSIEAPSSPVVVPSVEPVRRTIRRTRQGQEAVALLQRLQAE